MMTSLTSFILFAQPGYNGVIGCFVASFVFTAALLAVIRWENSRRDRVYGSVIDAGVEDGQLPALNDQTDGQNHNFRYIY